ncbi:MAG: SPOR domain-containing protein, partial [Candidatus Hydrogenedentota bacterium]
PAPAEASDTSEPAAEETLEHATRAEKSTPAKKPKRVELSPKSETEKNADSATGKPKKKPETTETENNKSEVRTESTAGDSNQETQTKTEPSEQPERDTELAIDKIDLPPDNLPAASPPKGDGKPFYSIQLIAFSKANRDKAKAYAKEVRESAGLDVEVEDSSNGEYVRVFVGRYADRASALRACRELQKQEQFSKVFVPQHPRGGKNTP